jgi:hypothetical protein
MFAKYAFIMGFIAAPWLGIAATSVAKTGATAGAQKTIVAPETIVAYPSSPHSSFGSNASASKSVSRARKHRLDLDRDGYVSKSELEQDQQRSRSAFNEADQNSDGRLNADEARRFQTLVKEKSRKRKR